MVRPFPASGPLVSICALLPSLWEHSVVGEKESDRSRDGAAGAVPPSARLPDTDSMSDIPVFTPEEWKWLKEQTRGSEERYVPTRSYIPGI